MRDFSTLVAFSFILALAGCSKPETVTQSPTSPPGLSTSAPPEVANESEACSLLTSREIETIQGSPLKETKSSSSSQPGITVSQCYFLLPTAADSVVLTVTRKAGGQATRDPKALWEEMFHRDREEPDAHEERDRHPPEKIPGLGDEAFWAPQGFGGALFARKGNIYVRISVGGPGEQATKLQKSKALAEIVLKRL